MKVEEWAPEMVAGSWHGGVLNEEQGGGGYEWRGEKLFSVEVGGLTTLQLVFLAR